MSLPENLEIKIKEMLVDRLFLSVEPEALSDTANLYDEFGVDSVSLLEMIVGLEDEFGLVIDPATFDPQRFETVSAICAYVRAIAG